MDKALYEQAVALRRELHAHPELSNCERGTKERLMRFLREHTDLELVDRGKWFYAVYRAAPDRPRIAFRAELDALPIEETLDLPYGSQNAGAAHKCGHDGHAAILAALAIEAARKGSENTLYFLFQHAEETGDGAAECAALIDEEGIDEVYAWHNKPGVPRGEVQLRHGTVWCASRGMSLFFTGVTAHASAPEHGRNPAFAIARMISALPTLTRPEDYEDLVMCTVIHVQVGEIAFGTSPGDGVLRLTIRAQHERELDRLQARVDALARSLAEEHGLTYHAEFCDCFPETANDDACVEKVRAACAALAIPVREPAAPERSSEDFGHFGKRARSAYFMVGAGDIPDWHTTGFDFPEEIIPTAFALLSRLAGIK